MREVVAQLVKISRCPTRITGIAGPEKPALLSFPWVMLRWFRLLDRAAEDSDRLDQGVRGR